MTVVAFSLPSWSYLDFSQYKYFHSLAPIVFSTSFSTSYFDFSWNPSLWRIELGAARDLISPLNALPGAKWRMDSWQCPNCIPENIKNVGRVILLPTPAQSGIRHGDPAGSVGDRSTIWLVPAPSSDPLPDERTTQSSLFGQDSKTEHAASPICFHWPGVLPLARLSRRPRH